jgi:hypothetical protein
MKGFYDKNLKYFQFTAFNLGLINKQFQVRKS